MQSRQTILKIAIDTPVRKLFDYLPPVSNRSEIPQPGTRVRVPFGKSRFRIGVVVEISRQTTIEFHRLKTVAEVLDDKPVISKKLLDFFMWSADYYHHPIGEVILGGLPGMISNGRPLIQPVNRVWKATRVTGPDIEKKLGKAPAQRVLWEMLARHPGGLNDHDITKLVKNGRSLLKALQAKGLVQVEETMPGPDMPGNICTQHNPNQEQQVAIEAIQAALDRYHAFLLNGVTGSGKTEVYIHAIDRVIAQGKQALVLVPEIGLTPQLIDRFKQQLGCSIAVMHSGLTDNERKSAWLNAREHRAQVIIGTRSAVWIPLQSAGIIIVDEEHDLSYKQQEGFRYSARDLAVIRARQESIPIVLGSATPSMESILNSMQGRYTELQLKQRAGSASMPRIKALDIRNTQMDGALSGEMIKLIRQHLDRNNQVLLFLNRRGYAPVMMCHQCGWICKCPRCEIQLTYHKSIGKLCCHHCQYQQKMVHECGNCNAEEIVEIGHGTQRLMETLVKIFPDKNIARLDRDATKRKGSLETILNKVHRKEINILVGTQIMSKGHHFPDVTLVGIIDSDRGLFSADYRSSERLAQLVMQVSGRAGRSSSPGEVVIQTHYPEHPLIRTLVTHDYSKLTALILQERESTGLPPYTYQVLLRAEANDRQVVNKFLSEAGRSISSINQKLHIFGPYMAPIEKKAGKYRMQLLLQSETRKAMAHSLSAWTVKLAELPGGKKVRWALDVDPQDLL